MNKKELVTAIVNKTKLSKNDAEKIINVLLDIIKSKLQEGEKIQIIGFGSFEVKERSERKVRNPLNGEEIILPPTKTPLFKPGKTFKEVVNQKSIIDDFISSGKINEMEVKILTYVCSHTDPNLFNEIELKDLAEYLEMGYEVVEEIAVSLINKKILDTMVYYGPVNTVYLRKKYHKFL